MTSESPSAESSCAADAAPTAAPPRKVVFLDVDGVLHPLSADSFFHAPCMAAMRAIVGQSGAAIVLSSSWQAHPACRAQVDVALRANGLPPCADCTRSHGGRTASGARGRADEIREWVAAHRERCAGGWVALDDLDLSPHLPADAFVHTEAEAGLTEADARRAVELLGGPDATLPPLPSPPRSGTGFNVIVTRGEIQRELMRSAMANAMARV